MLPTRPTGDIILMFTLDILYSHHSLAFAIQTAKAAAKKKGCPETPQIQGFPLRPN